MKVYLVIVASLLSLTAYNDQQINTAYLCNKNTVILNVINKKNAELTFNDTIYLLNHEESASGKKYQCTTN